MAESLKTVVVIPIYKNVPDNIEYISFSRCLDVFRDNDIVIACPDKLELERYSKIAGDKKIELKIERFEPGFFSSIESYNRLMMDLDFYDRFKLWDYMLIYQLDAYVFEDMLEYWCSKGYDYIGAPWFDDYKSKELGSGLWAVGNGGFSLRKVQSFVDILKLKKPIKGYKQLREDYKRVQSGFIKKIISPFIILFRLSGYKNTIEYWKTQCGANEDFFWTMYLDKLGIGLKRPTPEEAVDFAFEQSPSFLYEINGSRLPFGCHAWQKYEYEVFWKKYIDSDE
ncbi:MAG TPA: DUF5672 family protein [Paludibacter sp.]|nr:DUF5672 family protein [Paludibacter sp.]